jgi:hypothetical protein
LDVNDDGDVTAIDALQVINRLNRAGNVTGIPVLPTDTGPPYYDVTGDLVITALDAFRVINELSRRDARGNTVEGETVATSPPDVPVDVFAPIDVSASRSQLARESTETIAETRPRHLGGGFIEEKTASFDGDSLRENALDDAIALIASQQDTPPDEDETLAALDVAMADLM